MAKAMREVKHARPATLAAYLGPGKAARLLADEEAARREHEAEEREARRQGRRPTVETAEEERVAV